MFKNNWIEFHPKFSHFAMTYEVAGYFDERPLIHFCLGWGQLFVHLPIKTGRLECENPTYGIYYFGKAFVLCKGEKRKYFRMPWDWEWVRISVLTQSGTWVHETKKQRRDFWDSKWDKVIYREQYPYKYKLKNGEVQERVATIKVEKREWRWKALMWSKFPRMIRKTIDVEFNDEVGESTGSWKGGTIGCSYDMMKGETPLECLKRMERERTFN